MALRVDIGRLKPARELPDGRMLAEAHITRVGVFEYIDEEGNTRREYRPPEEVFAPDSLDSFRQVPVTNNHPPEQVTAKNARRYMVGATGERIERDDDHVRAALMFADSDTLEEMKRDGKVEVSCGYTCDVVEKAGEHPVYGKYDAVQTNIRGNHVAIVHRARAGKTARVRIDEARAITKSTRGIRLDTRSIAISLDSAPRARQDDDVNPTPRGRSMPAAPKKKDKTDELTVEVAAEQLVKAEARADAAERALDAERKRADAAEGRVESLEEQVKALEESRVDEADLKRLKAENEELAKKLARETTRADEANDPKRRAAEVRRRATIERHASVILGDGFVCDSLTDREVMVAVVGKLSDIELGSDRTDEYVRARFDAAVEGWTRGIDANERLREVARTRVEPEVREDASTARARYNERQRNAWKPQTAAK